MYQHQFEHPETERYLQHLRDSPGGDDEIQLSQKLGEYIQESVFARARANAICVRLKELETLRLIGANQ